MSFLQQFLNWSPGETGINYLSYLKYIVLNIISMVGGSEGRGHHVGTGDGGPGGYVGALPPAPDLMVPGREDVEHDPGGEGGEVPNGLHYGDGSPYLLECVRLGPQA